MPAFTNSGRRYTPNEIEKVLDTYVKGSKVIKNTKKVSYYNIPASFDIEFTSFQVHGEKRSIMYAWTFGINGGVILGRTWDEFLHIYSVICEKLGLWKDYRLIVYCHNLGIEFQAMRCLLEWEKVFAMDVRKPLYAITKQGVEFRCSYLLSGYSLAVLGTKLTKYPVQKMVGDLDYKKVRHCGTPLTDKEQKYCENDVRVVMAYIQEKIEIDGNITKIPLTKTGYVRNYCRKCCLYDHGRRATNKKFHRYNNLMNALSIEPDEYRELKRCFQGGFTHASCLKSGRVYYNVSSFDFTSSYPAVMLSEKFPMSKGQHIQIQGPEHFRQQLSLYCCMFDIEFTGLQAKTLVEHPLSFSKCWGVIKPLTDNGRLVSADLAYTTITEQDFWVLEHFYTWNKIRVRNFIRYKRGYLPTDFVKAILKLYGDKTELKGVKGREIDYAMSKEMVNASYGMTVTDICKAIVTYMEDWEIEGVDIEKSLAKYNKSKRRFLFYPWGVWITSYARRNLFTGILAFGSDYIYSDTDSIKAIHGDKHIDYINAYNRQIVRKLDAAMYYHGIDKSAYSPKTIKGEEKTIGLWDFEGVYSRFKTLGAKRYMTEENGEISFTISGLNKRIAIPYLKGLYCGNTAIFNNFEPDQFYIPPGHTGKNCHTYIDYPVSGVITDYMGNTAEYHEESATHLGSSDYSLKLSVQYADYLRGIRIYEK